MYDVTAIGELLIDFTPNGSTENDILLFERNPGGAPANVVAALAKLGKKTSFIGKVGNDEFGMFLRDELEKSQIETKGLVFSDEVNTTLAFVHLNRQGDRSFTFYRNPGADMTLREEEIDLDIIKNSRIFHFGSLSMTHEPAASATLKAVSYAKDKGLIISYDPNLRKALWDNLDRARFTILQGLKYADIVKISEEELEFLTGTKELESGSLELQSQFQNLLIFVTLGSDGSFYRFGNQVGISSGYPVKTVDTTGAGDAFLAGILYRVLEENKNLTELTVKDIKQMVGFANAVGALATTKKGAIPAMPSANEVYALMKR
jgi:fructokinase